jgi:hypothetical protein
MKRTVTTSVVQGLTSTVHVHAAGQKLSAFMECKVTLPRLQKLIIEFYPEPAGFCFQLRTLFIYGTF